MPAKIWLSSIQPEEGASVMLVGVDKPLIWEKTGNGFVVNIPEQFQKMPPCKYAWVVKISAIK